LGKPADPYVQQAIAYSFARAGDIGKAVTALDQLVGQVLSGNEPYPWQREMAERARALKARLLVNPASAQQQLEAWESETAKNLGLEKFGGSGGGAHESL
jgi:hypothetical protein